MATRLINEPFFADVVGESVPDGHPIIGTGGSGDVSGSVATMVDAHAALATGVHGVGASTVESVAGSAAKVTAHEAASDPHAGGAAYARKPVANTFTAAQSIILAQNAVTRFTVSNTTSGTSAGAELQLISDNNGVGASRSMELRLVSEGASTDAGAARWSSTNSPDFLVSAARGSTVEDERVRFRLGGAFIFKVLRRVTTNLRAAIFFSDTSPDQGGDEYLQVKAATTAPTVASTTYAALWAVAGAVNAALHALGDLVSHGQVYAEDTKNVLARANHTGTTPDASLTSNVPLKDAANVFTVAQTFNDAVTIGGTATFLDSFEAQGGQFDAGVVFNDTVTVNGETHIAAQTIIGADAAPAATAALEVRSTVGGLLLPRMTTTQRDALSSPPDGLVLYNTTTTKVEARAAGAWVALH